MLIAYKYIDTELSIAANREGMSHPSQKNSYSFVFLFFPKANSTKKMMRITTNMPIIPCAIRVNDLPNIVFIFPSLQQTRDQAQDDTTGNDRGNLSCYVRPDCMHQKVVLRVSLLPHPLDDAR